MKSAQVLFFLFVLSLVHPQRLAAEQFSIDGYNLWIDGVQEGARLSVQGRISDGPQCGELELTAQLRSIRRERKTIRTSVADCGGFGSRLFQSSPVRVALDEGQWRVSKLSLRCLKD